MSKTVEEKQQEIADAERVSQSTLRQLTKANRAHFDARARAAFLRIQYGIPFETKPRPSKKRAERSGDDESSVAVPLPAKKAAAGRKAAASPAAFATPAPPKKKDRSTEPWVCAGNVLTGEACPADSAANAVRARVDTRSNGRTVPTCEPCRKAIAAARRAANKTAKAAETSAAEASEQPRPEEHEEPSG